MSKKDEAERPVEYEKRHVEHRSESIRLFGHLFFIVDVELSPLETLVESVQSVRRYKKFGLGEGPQVDVRHYRNVCRVWMALLKVLPNPDTARVARWGGTNSISVSATLNPPLGSVGLDLHSFGWLAWKGMPAVALANPVMFAHTTPPGNIINFLLK